MSQRLITPQKPSLKTTKPAYTVTEMAMFINHLNIGWKDSSPSVDSPVPTV